MKKYITNNTAFISSLFNFKQIRKVLLFKKLYKPIKYNINSILNTWTFNKLSRKAMRMHKSTGKQYYIVPAGKHTCMIVDSNYRKILNRKVYKKNPLSVNDFLHMAYFLTPTGTNSINK